MTGYDSYQICEARPSMGRFHYASNVYKAFSQVHVDSEKLMVKMIGVDANTKETVELHRLILQK